MFSKSTKFTLCVTILVLLFAAVFLQAKIDPLRHQFEPASQQNVGSAEKLLPVDFALGAALGFREAIAGLLWVRTDQFFDEGDYDAIVPMVRIVTWLDPHNTDVYETGAWHLDYNFTDSDQRSDRRYIPDAVALMQEAIQNNPTDTTLYADLAFTHLIRKVQDVPKAIYWFQKGQAYAASQPDTWDVMTVGHGLAHAYEDMGQIDKAIDEWRFVIKTHEANMAKNPKDVIDTMGNQTAMRNLNEDIGRAKWRPQMTKPPVDTNFDVSITRIAPMVFQVSGHMHMLESQGFILETGAHKWVVAQGDRVDLRLQDADYKMPDLASLGLNADVNPKVTILQDSISIRNDTFHKKIDMSADHFGTEPMYPFTADKYTFTFWFNPSNTNSSSPQIGDRIGWLGEGMTDKKYLDMSGVVPGTQGDQVPGLHMIKKTITLTRADIMGTKIQTFH